MQWRALLIVVMFVCGPSLVAEAKNSSRPTHATRVASSAAPGQAGYVHYFLIEHADESLEYQVGIELGDQRIAWSFPDAGVVVSPFVQSGQIEVKGKHYKIKHLYGFRPFANAQAMQTLRQELTRRVALWVDDETPYCVFRVFDGPFCLSCGDFALRILYPGTTPLTPALPRDFGPAISTAGYTTDDLLLYLVGLHRQTTTKARLKQLARLNLPANLREDLLEMITSADPAAGAVAAADTPPAQAAKPQAAPKPAAKLVQRRQARKNL